jgi:dihydroorotate dehydrogenase electron transfer subunit
VGKQFNKPRVVKVLEIVRNTPTVKTLFFEDQPSTLAKPGEFLMVWVADGGEIPMSVSIPHPVSGIPSITVRRVGKTSSQLFELEPGEKIGVRGPYGNGFLFDGLPMGRILLVGGGTGLAPLARFVFQRYKGFYKDIGSFDFVIAARTKEELIFYPEIDQIIRKPDELFASTDDGSFGFKGLAHHLVEDLMERRNYGSMLTCGPELMMRSLYDVSNAHNVVNQQYSLERLMKCAVRLCGICSIGRYLLCADGPVLFKTQVQEIQHEFGRLQRDHSGCLRQIGEKTNSKVPLKNLDPA